MSTFVTKFRAYHPKEQAFFRIEFAYHAKAPFESLRTAKKMKSFFTETPRKCVEFEIIDFI